MGIVSCGDAPVANSDPAPLPLRPRFAIDGEANLSVLPMRFDQPVAWEGAGPVQPPTRMQIALLNDDVDVYLVVRWEDTTYDDDWDVSNVGPEADGLLLSFDSDGDGVAGTGDDARVVYTAHGGALYFDASLGGGLSPGGPFTGVRVDQVGHGLGRLAYDAQSQEYTAEFLLPLDPGPSSEDGVLKADTRFAVSVFDASRSALASPFGGAMAGASAAEWPSLELVAMPPHSRPMLPDDLSGVIALLSEHEGRRKTYLYRPGSRTLSEVALDPDLHVARLALSHDRNWLLLEASRTPEDRNSFEVYRVGSDGSRLRQLTDNQVYDGTPAWSADDARVTYTSERDPGSGGRRHGSIVVMSAEGVELDDLSSRLVDERDPSYLPDGRIVFKTTRASPWPQYRIAAVRETGTAFTILTEALGGTDHHPVGRDVWIYYERFGAPNHYATDPGRRTKPWNILSVHAGGGQGGTLVADGWANRMPVPDPTGEYVAYLRQSGHSYLELVTKTGTFLGQLLPGVTEIVQFDWK